MPACADSTREIAVMSTRFNLEIGSRGARSTAMLSEEERGATSRSTWLNSAEDGMQLTESPTPQESSNDRGSMHEGPLAIELDPNDLTAAVRGLEKGQGSWSKVALTMLRAVRAFKAPVAGKAASKPHATADQEGRQDDSAPAEERPAEPQVAVEDTAFFHFVIEPMKRYISDWQPIHTEMVLATVSVLSTAAINIGAPLKEMPNGPARLVAIGGNLKLAGAATEGVTSAIEVIRQLCAEQSNPIAMMSGTFGLVGAPLYAVGEEGPDSIDKNVKYGLLIAGVTCLTLRTICRMGALGWEQRRMEAARQIGELPFGAPPSAAAPVAVSAMVTSSAGNGATTSAGEVSASPTVAYSSATPTSSLSAPRRS